MPVLLGAAATGRHDLFAYLLLYAMVSDIADGLLARSLHLESDSGARLDSIADLGTVAVSIAGLAAFQRPFLSSHPHSIGAFVIFLSFEIGFAFWRYGRVSSFHTYLSRAAAYAMGIFIMDLFLIGFHAWLYYVALTIALLSYIEEIALVAYLREWRADVRGLYWVLKGRAQT